MQNMGAKLEGFGIVYAFHIVGDHIEPIRTFALCVVIQAFAKGLHIVLCKLFKMLCRSCIAEFGQNA